MMNDVQVDNPPTPHYYMPGEVKALRNEDRRFYRRRVIALVLYQFAVIIPVRISIDFVLAQPKFASAHFIKPYVIYGLALTVFLIWVAGLNMAFKRRY
jgi:hypothetical protein